MIIYYKRKSLIKKIKSVLSEITYKRSVNCTSFFAFLKRLFFLLVFILGATYFVYLFLLPKYINENKIETYVNNYLSKNTKLILDVENFKIYPNYKFDINLKADKISLKYSKNKDFLILDKPNIEINLITLFFNYIDLNKIKAQKITINTTFTKNKKYNCFDYFSPELLGDKSDKSKFELRNIKILVNKFNLNIYDENIKKTFYVNANNIKFTSSGLNNKGQKPFSVKSYGTFSSSNNKIADFNLNLNFKLRQKTIKKYRKLIEKLNYNPFIYADKYNFRAFIDIDLKITPLDENTNIEGKINLKDYSFNIDKVRIPKNNLVLLFKGDKIISNCDFNLIKNQFIKVKSIISISKNKFIELKLNSNDINLSELSSIINAFNKILNLNLRYDEITLNGSAVADLYIKSNFKTINSNGNLKIKNASVFHKKTGLKIKDINSNINFANNKINILNSYAYIDNSKFHLEGLIDKNTNLNIKMQSDLINIAQFLTMLKSLPFSSSILKDLKDYDFKDGLLKIQAQIKGNLKAPLIEANSSIKNLKIYIKPYKTLISSNEIKLFANPKNNKLDFVDVLALDNKINNNNNILTIPKLKLKIDENNIEIDSSKLNFDKITADFKGNVIAYKTKQAKINLNINGLIPKQNKIFIIKNKAPLLKADISIKKDILEINNLDLISNNENILNLKGSILKLSSKNPEFNNLKINIPSKTSLTLPKLDNASIDLTGQIELLGNIKTPNINADLKIDNLIYKPCCLYIKDLILNIKNSKAYINITKGKFFDSDFDLVAEGKYTNKEIIVDFLNVQSNYINLSIFEKLNKTNQTSQIPIKISNLKGSIMTLQLADILLNSVYFEGTLENNILNLAKYSADAFRGNTSGSININLKNSKISTQSVLREINVRLLSNQIKEFSIAASGKLSALTNIEFCGYDYNSIIKTLKGYIKFNIDNGELTQFAKLERYLQAGNILSQSILKLSLNSAVSAITKQNTGDFKTIEGTFNINNSWIDIQYIKTQGTNMSTYLTGRANMLSKYCAIKVYGKIPTSMVNIMGNIGSFTTNELVNKMSDDAKEIIKSITVSPIEKMLSIKIPDEYIEKIPPLTISNTPTREFMVIIDGPIEQKSSVRYFKWNLKEAN